MISTIVPSRGRPEKLKRLIDSVANTSVLPFEVLVFVDNDDPSLPDYQNMMPQCPNTKLFVESRRKTSETFNFLFQHSKGDIIAACSDDMESITPSWDSIITESVPKDNVFMSCAASGGGEAQFLGRKGVELIGFVFNPVFNHYYGNTWLCDFYQHIGRRIISNVAWLEERVQDATREYQVREDCKYIHQDSANYRDNGPLWIAQYEPIFLDYINRSKS